MNRKLIITAILTLAAFGMYAQENKNAIVDIMPEEKGAPVMKAAAPETEKIDENKIYREVEEKPQPNFDLTQFLQKNLRYPDEARKAEVSGRINVQFVVERDGSITNVEVIRGAELGHGLPEEAIRIVKSMPRWKPATLHGHAVRSYFTMPFAFSLQ